MKISVIVPVYNAEKYIAQALDNIVFQTYQNLEIIVVLDGGTDDSEKIINKYIADNKSCADRIKVVKHEKNKGLSAARNSGVAAATGEYIHFMDSDDLINIDFYKNMIECIVTADADMAVGNMSNEKYPTLANVEYQNAVIMSAPQDKIDTTQADRHGYCWRYLIRKSFWIKNKFEFPVEFKSIEDLPLMIRAVHAANRIITVPGARYIYKYRAASWMRNKIRKKMNRDNMARAKPMVKDFMKDNNLEPSRMLARIVKYNLFGIIPIMRKIMLKDQSEKIYLFGIKLLRIK